MNKFLVSSSGALSETQLVRSCESQPHGPTILKLGPEAIGRVGSPAHKAHEFLLRHPGRVFTHAQLIEAAGHTANAARWSLIYLQAMGLVEVFGHPSNKRLQRYRLAQPMSDESSTPQLRHFDAHQDQVIVEMVPASNPALNCLSQGDVRPPTPALMSWFENYCDAHQVKVVPIREILRCGPSAFRTKAELNAALSELIALEKVTLIRDGRKNVVKLFPGASTVNPAAQSKQPYQPLTHQSVANSQMKTPGKGAGKLPT
jgi:hypothetical protein